MAKLSHKFDPFDSFSIEVPRADRKEALAELAEYLKTEVLSNVGDGVSPVTGRKWAALSSGYKKKKGKGSSSNIANLELSGDMLDSYDVLVNGNSLESGVFGDRLNIDKARGHNQLGEPGPPGLPRRQFIPDDDGTYRKGILDGMRKILRRYEG